MSVVVVGLNHRSVPVDVLERVAVAPESLPRALGDLLKRDHITEAVLVSTCLRTEAYIVAEKYHGGVADVRAFLSQWSLLGVDEFASHLYELSDEAAVGHLFRVAAGLDSAVLGEGEILGQVRASWQTAQGEGSAGPVLSGLFRHAVEVGKRSRSETAIARGTTSLSQAAVELARRQLGSELAEQRVLVIGAGDMGEGMALALATSGAASITIANRTASKADAIATRIDATAIDFDDLSGAVADADLVLTSTGAPAALLDVELVRDAVAARPDRPLLIIDLAVPRDVEPSVAELAGVTLLDMDDVSAFAERGRAARRVEVAGVEEIVIDELARYAERVAALRAAPLVAALRAKAERARDEELTRQKARLADLTDDQREAVDQLTRSLVNKLLHDPTVALKDAAGSPRGERLAEAVRTLFELE